MFRNHLSPEPGFQWRSTEITRLEGFSDAVFAFAVTLLVVSLEVPHTYAELKDVMRGFPAFAICFALLAQVWYEHAKYSRRYGFQGPYTVFLNSLLLFVVLFYVYPLKFLFTMLLGLWTGGATLPHAATHEPMIVSAGEVRSLMIIYALGFAAVFVIFGLMYITAYRRRATLNLDPVETSRTRHSLIDNFAMAAIGLLSAALAAFLPIRLIGLAGYAYFLIGFYHWISGTMQRKEEERIGLSLAKRSTKAAEVK